MIILRNRCSQLRNLIEGRREEKMLKRDIFRLRGFGTELRGLIGNFRLEILSMYQIDGAILGGNILKKVRCKNGNILIVQTEIILGLMLRGNF